MKKRIILSKIIEYDIQRYYLNCFASIVHEFFLTKDNYLNSIKPYLKVCDVNETDNNGSTALLYAVYRNKLDLVKLLLDNRADINIVNKTGCCVLNCAQSEEMKTFLNSYLYKDIKRE